MNLTLFRRWLPLAATLAAGPLPAQPEVPAPAPKIQFAELQHDFGRMMAGAVVKHDYVFTNTGGAILTINNVHASCGCTATADWTREVPPGGTGRIPIQFNSANFLGTVFKTVTVSCNDPAQPTTVLQLKATIWKPVEVQPMFAVINVPPDAEGPVATTVRVANQLDEPLTVFPPESNLPHFRAWFATNTPGREFNLTIETVPPLPPGNTQGQITFRTSSTNTPVINLPVIAVVQPALSVSPAQLMLPAQLPTPPPPYVITVRNQTARPLAVSDVVSSSPVVSVALREVEPGRQFQLEATFPPNFELPPGERIQITARTSLPSQPTITIPVSQFPRPRPPGL